MILANGGKENALTHLADGTQKATVFTADDKALFHAIMGS